MADELQILRTATGYDLLLPGETKTVKLTEGWVVAMGGGKAAFSASLPTRVPRALEVDVKLTVGKKQARQGWHPAPDATHRCRQCGRWLDAAVDPHYPLNFKTLGNHWGTARYHDMPGLAAGTGPVPCGPVDPLDPPLLTLTGTLTGLLGGVVATIGGLL